MLGLTGIPPVITHLADRHRYVCHTARYGAHDQLLDVWMGDIDEPAPVLIFIPGGAWLIGKRWPQGYALMSHLVRRGFICVAIDYRAAPWHRWPSQFEDVCAAINWVHTHIADFGGDPDFLALSGASAGGHLAALAGLTMERRIQAVAPLYGVYDWTRPGLRRFFVECVVTQRFDPEILAQASPITWVHDAAPPFLVVHGETDHIIPPSEGRRFAEALGCPYLEARGAGHGFDLTDAKMTRHVVHEVGDFLGSVHEQHTNAKLLTGVTRTVGF